MPQSEPVLFTVGVFQDLAWAERGIEALKKQGFGAGALTVAGKLTPELVAAIERAVGGVPGRWELPGIGPVVAHGSLFAVLDGPAKDLGRTGLAAAMRRAGFQPHDGLIYETLVERGGVLVAVEDAPRATDALSVLLSYGAGNSAIGAWQKRL
ncbi:MAG TPA: hypothetical protein PKH99_10785 [Vicinamibacterales bacterium]|nr:hypothetical protein [Vicinamibacterales bacterium]